MKRECECSSCKGKFVLKNRLFIASTVIKNGAEVKQWQVKAKYRCKHCGNTCEVIMPILDADMLGIYRRANKMVDLRLQTVKQIG